MTRFPLGAWLLFAAVAALPLAGACAVAWKLHSSAMLQAQADEDARVAAAGAAAEREISGFIAEAKDKVVNSTEPDGVRVRGADPVVLDQSGALKSAGSLGAEPPPSAACEAARAGLLSGSRAAARDEILARCEDLRSTNGRFLWPLLALETAGGEGKLPAWLGAHATRLGPDERAVLTSRLAALDPTLRTRCVAALARPPSANVVLESLLTQGAETIEGPLRVRKGKYVTVLRPFEGGLAGCAFHAASILREPPALPDDLTLAVGRGAATVTVTPELLLHVELRSGSSERALVRRTANRILVLTLAGTFATLLLAIAVYARLLHARRLAELRTDFVAAVSHELRTPLASVQMLAELLEGGAVDPGERAEVQRTLAREARRLSATLTRMLRFGALSRGKLQPERSRQPLAPIVREAVERFGRAHPGRSVDLDLDESAVADVDAALLALVLDNLLGNAAKYAPEGGPYRVRVAREGDVVRLSVEDRGPGLDRRAATRVFLPFERADDRLVRATEGTGVGLALVRGIAEAHGGRARVVSEVGKGSTFIVEVPWKPS